MEVKSVNFLTGDATYGAYNRALRITGMTSSLSDSNHPGTLYSAAHYNAAGRVTSASIGNTGSSVNETRSYDGRLARSVRSRTQAASFSHNLPRGRFFCGILSSSRRQIHGPRSSPTCQSHNRAMIFR